MRNPKGQFIHGHKPLSSKDKNTGRFVKRSVEKPTKLSEKLSVEEQVDNFLHELERNESD